MYTFPPFKNIYIQLQARPLDDGSSLMPKKALWMELFLRIKCKSDHTGITDISPI